ncbi:putative hydrolase of the HAD superfamily [Hypnocyclicus thermotrophus]|uniref:Hydrolase of the HAD superfamily n=1 Tax=Hypnocyclicus thermotrophus TaxID=1627895 RepID=A0AA46E005_9FUSO|nr:HAD family hydrolase [Hypnocyclicus thermotrophus]TDT72254.1 putative hydrolase of the HAD superfamily [Hypnocyclicus thermotrophus]
MYKNYIFDLYGTLIDINTDENKQELWEILSSFYSYNGAIYSADELKKSYLNKAKKYYEANKSEAPDIKIEKVFEELYLDKTLDISQELILSTCKLFRILSTKYIKLYENVKPLLEILKKQNKKIFLLSNAQREFTLPELEYLDIKKYFDGIYISSDYEVGKPSVKFFEELIKKEKIKIKESIMVGNDYRTDIEGAERMGMDSIYLHTNLSPDITENIPAKFKIYDNDILKIPSFE